MNFHNVIIVKMILVLVAECDGELIEKVCSGTTEGFTTIEPTNRDLHYQIQRDRYTNCTYIDGNLEITWITNATKYNLDHLQHIREVSGYVLINHVEIKDVVLPNLQIVRGETLLEWNPRKQVRYALFVYDSLLNTLQMPALRAILNGSVLGMMYANVCFLGTINWDEILGTGARQNFIYFNQVEEECGQCDPSCEAGCWAEGQQNCQTLKKCSKKCAIIGCFTRNSNDCCHPYCAGGCTGPTEHDCFACRKYNDKGVCRTSCSANQYFNQTIGDWLPSSDRNLVYGGQCVDRCPEPYKNDNGTCVRTCPRSKVSKNGVCRACGEDEFCPKICIGQGVVNAQNIEQYGGCNIIIGSVEISNETFDGFHKIHPDELRAFLELQEVTDNLNIQGQHAQFTNLSFFGNLSVIGGSLYISKSSLKSLELKSLKQLYGVVAISGNPDLCYVGGMNWSRLQVGSAMSQVLGNRNPDECKKDGYVCYEQCNEATGCMGGGPDQCLECVNWTYRDTCVTDCSSLAEDRNIFQNHTSRICGDCHPECKNSCTTSDADTCDACAHVKNGPICVSACPKEKYDENGICQPCHDACDGCLGPNDSLSKDGCTSCHLAIRLPSSEIKCLRKPDDCPVGFYPKVIDQTTTGLLEPLIGRKICLPCHTGCRVCTGPGLHHDECQQCANYTNNDMCVTSCANDQYVDTYNECRPCSPECRSCYDTGANRCLECVEFKVIANDGTTFNCTLQCPPELPYVVDRVCAVRPQYIEIVIVAIIIFLAMLLLVLICCCKAQKARNEKVQMSLLAGFEDTVPLCQTGASPNLRKIRIIKEAEIRKGSVLGTGEFGQVLKGLWVPENENLKIPIAIKSFRTMNDPKSSAEFMAEAQIMASLDHPNILKLMAVCLTDEMMMITQLMPLGNLLDYVRKNQDKIDSKTMLNWAVQIAQGMAYLEARRLVHRDLAARNVLVQAHTSVRIADFGMTKLLKNDTLTYESPGGKAAVKWLAPECIDHKTFTSKSDVWAFGVTVWEVLTYGAIPYTETKSQDVPKLVTAGEKLPQPDICSLELYALLLLCWNLKPELRPTFSDLKKYLTEMASDPACYLVIVGDKLMRLPELTKEDEISYYSDLAKLDSSDAQIVEAERYVELRNVKPSPPVDADNYLLPNPPCNLPDGPGYLKIEANRVSETPTIQITETTETATDDERYVNMEAAYEESGQGLDSLGRHYMNLIRNQGNLDDSRNSYVSDISIDPEEYLEPGLPGE